MKKFLAVAVTTLCLLGIISCGNPTDPTSSTSGVSTGDSTGSTGTGLPGSGITGGDDSSTGTTYFTITYESDFGKATEIPLSTAVVSGFALTEDYLPSLSNDVNHGYVFSRWMYKSNSKTVQVGDTVTDNVTLVAEWKDSDGNVVTAADSSGDDDSSGESAGKADYYTLKFDVSGINTEYSLSLEAPKNVEIAGPVNYEYSYMQQVLDYLPSMDDVTIAGTQYKILWTYNDKILANSITSRSGYQTYIYEKTGTVTTLKATLKKYSTITLKYSRGTKTTDTFKAYEGQQITFSDLPKPVSPMRAFINFKRVDEDGNCLDVDEYYETETYVFTSAASNCYTVTSEDAIFEAVFKDLALGDVILADGSVITMSSASSYSYTEDNPAIAVVFYLGDDESRYNTDKVLAIGTKFSDNLIWCDAINSDNSVTTASYYSGKNNQQGWTPINATIYENVSYYYIASYGDDTDGSNNYSLIKEIEGESSTANYPAFEYAENYGTNNGATANVLKSGWYLPTCNEYTCFIEHAYAIQDALVGAGANYDAVDWTSYNVPTWYVWTSNISAKCPICCTIQPGCESLNQAYNYNYDIYNGSASTRQAAAIIVIE